ncbi:hypothetical protein Glove_326g55 [Diversispora epigaea]|uniref:Uncharacterized protein n=1 Tax=Diversispora epigaea TaxID=1348612 RepID=A0A397HLV7_9GLOM|nr:hypothetical protein Glove_326g55 [Diversispora epigaea]
MARNNEKSSQEWYYVDLMAKIEDNKFPLSTPLDPFVPKDENEVAIAKAKAAEYTEKARRAANIPVELVQRDRRKLNKTELSIIRTDRRVKKRYSPYISSPLNDSEKKVREVRGKISKAYANRGRRSALSNSSVKLRLGIALFNVGAEKKPYYNNEYERYALGQKEEIVDVGDDGVNNIHAPEVDDKDIDVVNTDWEPDTHYTEARKLELFRWDLWLKQKYKH